MMRVDVELGARSYPIHIGSGLLNNAELLSPAIGGNQLAIVSNQCVAGHYLEPLTSVLTAARPELQIDTYLMPDGEIHKSFDEYKNILDFLLAKRHNRTTTLLALGGGVVGDLTGFVAATFQRGVGFVQVPTTLLALVDSSVGGKTAINHPTGKNLIGAFYQPSCVLADIDVLSTLPEREYAAGLAEVVKYGVIADAEFFDWCESNAAALLARDTAVVAQAVQRSVQLKAQVVAEDEREQGRRAILNFGHTFGHAVEKLTNYDAYLHGEAVAIGMVAAGFLSEGLGLLTAADAARIPVLLQRLGLPVTLSGNLSKDAMVQAMGMDKKVVNGRLNFIVATAIGNACVTDAVELAQLEDALQRAATYD